jgi:hypothetical protein
MRGTTVEMSDMYVYCDLFYCCHVLDKRWYQRPE